MKGEFFRRLIGKSVGHYILTPDIFRHFCCQRCANSSLRNPLPSELLIVPFHCISWRGGRCFQVVTSRKIRVHDVVSDRWLNSFCLPSICTCSMRIFVFSVLFAFMFVRQEFPSDLTTHRARFTKLEDFRVSPGFLKTRHPRSFAALTQAARQPQFSAAQSVRYDGMLAKSNKTLPIRISPYPGQYMGQVEHLLILEFFRVLVSTRLQNSILPAFDFWSYTLHVSIVDLVRAYLSAFKSQAATCGGS